jgi:hypothetical protein
MSLGMTGPYHRNLCFEISGHAGQALAAWHYTPNLGFHPQFIVCNALQPGHISTKSPTKDSAIDCIRLSRAINAIKNSRVEALNHVQTFLHIIERTCDVEGRKRYMISLKFLRNKNACPGLGATTSITQETN